MVGVCVEKGVNFKAGRVGSDGLYYVTYHHRAAILTGIEAFRRQRVRPLLIDNRSPFGPGGESVRAPYRLCAIQIVGSLVLERSLDSSVIRDLLDYLYHLV